MMNGHGAKLDRHQEAAIAALMAAPTVGEAARIACIGEATLRRWMASEPEFQAAYREARAEPLREAVRRLNGLLVKATETLERNMTCGVPGIEVRAAVAVFELVIDGTELLDLAGRVEALEEQKSEDGSPFV